mmetsp:Transcript_16978/g.40952  ORF Transcript_16978/g.40952 Transcript_16978/m.40952 type:complete len:233 (+) Transcript_16978:1023-1721(+)
MHGEFDDLGAAVAGAHPGWVQRLSSAIESHARAVHRVSLRGAHGAGPYALVAFVGHSRREGGSAGPCHGSSGVHHSGRVTLRVLRASNGGDLHRGHLQLDHANHDSSLGGFRAAPLARRAGDLSGDGGLHRPVPQHRADRSHRVRERVLHCRRHLRWLQRGAELVPVLCGAIQGLQRAMVRNCRGADYHNGAGQRRPAGGAVDHASADGMHHAVLRVLGVHPGGTERDVRGD